MASRGHGNKESKMIKNNSGHRRLHNCIRRSLFIVLVIGGCCPSTNTSTISIDRREGFRKNDYVMIIRKDRYIITSLSDEPGPLEILPEQVKSERDIMSPEMWIKYSRHVDNLRDDISAPREGEKYFFMILTENRHFEMPRAVLRFMEERQYMYSILPAYSWF